jgi:hypothetical protein
LHGVLEQLDREAESLFKPRGSTQKINLAIREYGEKNREIREVSLSSHKWTEHRRALSRINEELGAIRDELASRRQGLTRLKRTQRILPKLVRRDELLRKIDDFGPVVILPEDFKRRRQTAIQELEKAQLIERKAASRLEHQDNQLKEIQVRQDVLQEAETIEALHEVLGSHRKAMKDRPRLVAERNQLSADAESLLKEVRPTLSLDEVGELRSALQRRTRISELANQQQALIQGVKKAEKSLRGLNGRLKEARRSSRKLAESRAGAIVPIQETVAAAAKMGQIDELLDARIKDCQTLEGECSAQLARLTLWNGTLTDIPRLRIPARESVDRFEHDSEAIEKQKVRLFEKRNELSDALLEVERQLEELQRVGMVPTEENLNEARSKRDQAWQLLRRQWLGGEDVQAEATVLEPEHDLPDAFEIRIAYSDELADRLRREADRVLRQASLLAAQSVHRQQLEEIETRLDEVSRKEAQLNAEWQALWSPSDIEPQNPREMRAWLDAFERLREKAELLRVQCQETEALRARRETHIRALKEELDALGKEVPGSATSLAAILSIAEEVVDEMNLIQRKREDLDKESQRLERDLEDTKSEHQAASCELEAWKEEWQKALKELGLGPDALPSEVNEALERIREIFLKQGDAEKLRIRIEGMDRDSREFQTQLSEVAGRVSPELVSMRAEQSVVRLAAILSENRSGEIRCRQIESNKQQAEEEMEEARVTIEEMRVRLRELCAEANCEHVDQLETAERRSDEYQQLKSEADALEREILEGGEGASLLELREEAEGVDPDALPGQIEELTHTIAEELEPQQTRLAELKGREQTELKLMDGSDRAAELADEAQGILVGIRNHAEQYVRLRLAARILRLEIERYRRENQGPLVRRASEHFAVLTQGSFELLRVDFNEKDEPVLVGLRPGGERVHVEGMSSGTRDQLYLALRLAALEQYMEHSEPMPFIVDDILIQFDDDRCAATLKVLAKLGKKTQVILFTHHSRLVEQARRLNAKELVSVHQL